MSNLKMILAPNLKLIGMYIIYTLQTNTPTINLFREDLLAILFNSITKDTVQWPGGRTLAVKSVVLSDIQQHTLTFTDDSLLSVLPVMAPGSSFVFIP